jgi:hypothetical protein
MPPSEGEPRPTASDRSPTRVVALVLVVVLAIGAAAAGILLTLGGDDEDAATTTDDGAAVVEGTGYRYALPNGWQEVDDQFGDIDSMSAPDGNPADYPLVMVEIWSAEDASNLRELSRQWNADLGGGELSRVAIGIKAVDGVQTYTYLVDDLYVSCLVLRDGQAYAISLNPSGRDWSEVRNPYHQIVRSWTWQ